MTRREKILNSVLTYNTKFLLEHAAMPVNGRNEQRIRKLYKVIEKLSKRLHTKTVQNSKQLNLEI
jgi:hypothetical protein